MSKSGKMSEVKAESPDKVTEAATSMHLVTSEERDMSNMATEHFDKGNYDACLKFLKQLSEKRGPDPRVMLNMAVITFYKSGQTKTEEFKKALTEASTKAQVNVENISGLDDVDQCVFYYNHAVILYHQRQYTTALAIMEKLFQFIEPMEESLSRRVQFLQVELYLCTSQPEKALGMLGFLEKSLFGNGKSSQHTPDKELKETSKDDKNKDGGKDAGNTDGNSEVWKARISQGRARCYMMLRSLKSYKREVKTVIGLAANATPTSYLRSNFEYMRGNYRKAIKLLNSAPQPGRPTSETGECLPTMHYNNMAVIHFYMHKPNLAAFYLQKAVEENEKAAKQFNKPELASTLSGRTIQTLGVSRHFELLYNIGITLLHCGKAQASFDCLVQVMQMYGINPRLWLRLAECCIMVYKKDNEEDRELSKRMAVVRGSVGSGVHRKLLLGPGIQQEKKGTESPITPMPTLEFASLCLKNALMLLPEDPLDAAPSSGDEQEARSNSEASWLAPPGNPLKQQEVTNLRSSILLSSAYVSLCLNDYVLARSYADKLLKQPRLSGVQRYLGHMYLAEALVRVDRIAEAIVNFNPDNITDISMNPPENKQDAEKIEKNGDKENENGESKGSMLPWNPRDLPRAKAIMQYNLATAHALRGEFEKALMHLGKSIKPIGSPLPAQLYFLNIYLELMEGRRKVAHGIIKEHFGHMTPNRV